MRSIPRELDEAAMLDEANRFTIYRRIILPLLTRAIATVVIIKGWRSTTSSTSSCSCSAGFYNGITAGAVK